MADHDERYPKDEDIGRIIRIKSYRLARTLGAGSQSLDEFQQEYWMEYLQARGSFDPRRASWATFLEQVLESAGGHLMEKWWAQKRRYERGARSWDEPLAPDSDETLQDVYSDVQHYDQTGDGTPPMSEIIDCNIDVRDIVEALPPELQRIAKMLMWKTAADIALELGIPRTTVYTKMAKIRSVFESMKLGPAVRTARKSRQKRESSGR